MKQIVQLLTLLLLISTGVSAQQYTYKSGYIKLTLEGSTVGTREIWWDDWGQKRCELEKSTTTINLFGEENIEEKHTCNVVCNEKFWDADYITKYGTKGNVPLYQAQQNMKTEMSEAELDALGKQMLTSMGGEILGTENIDGYPCDIVEMMGIKVWIHRGLTLKSSGELMGMKLNEDLAEFKPNQEIPASKFLAPSGVEYTEHPSFGNVEMNDGESYYDDEYEEDEETIPVDYPFEDFKSAFDDFLHPDYPRKQFNHYDGIPTAIFIKDPSTVLSIAAESNSASPEALISNSSSFMHNGHHCIYGNVKDETGTLLFVEYAEHNMYIIIASMPGKSKRELLDISDQLKF